MLKYKWQLFATLLAIYALFYVILVGGLSSISGSDLAAVKSTLISGHVSGFNTSTSLFSTLIGSFGSNSSNVAGLYQTLLLLIISLVLIWALRHVYAGKAIRARDAFYKGLTPFIPFILVLLVVGLQFLPLVLGVGLYNIMVGGGIAIGIIEKFLVIVILFALAVVSVYWTSSSILALYVVTLPDMAPVQALRNARELVRHRRWIVLRKMLFLPVALIVVSAVILIPIASIITPVAPMVFFALTVLAVAVVHSYLFALYRELL